MGHMIKFMNSTRLKIFVNYVITKEMVSDFLLYDTDKESNQKVEKRHLACTTILQTYIKQENKKRLIHSSFTSVDFDS